VADQPVLRVAVCAPLQCLFDYLPPSGLDPWRLSPGVRLRVPFGRGTRVGILVDIAGSARVPVSRLKRAESLLDRTPLFDADHLAFLLWAAGYYQHPVGEVLAGAMPVWLRQGRAVPVPEVEGWRLTEQGRQVERATLRRAPCQARLVGLLVAAPGGLDSRALAESAGDYRAPLKALERKGWVERCRISPTAAAAGGSYHRGPTLNQQQQAAVDAILESLGDYAGFLLEGVTGSGKTEVYLRLVEQVLAQGRRALVLVPEIGLTPQLVRRLRRRIDRPMALLHSGLSEGRRAHAWVEAQHGRADLVVGTRSAVLTPLPGLGLIIVDEEHDLSFKQQDGFRYSARDLAVTRARRARCPVVLGSATPSLETLRNARTGRYRWLSLPERAGVATVPRLELIDIRSARLEAGMSPVLIRLVGEELARGSQVLLFLNRRGYAPVLTCHACGWVAECRRCDARMTLHLATGTLWCHHCGAQRETESRCPDCGGQDLRPVGHGTERLEEMLAARFPDAALVRIDRDSTRRKGRLETLLSEIREGRHALLLGTQMLAKGHHFPGVTLVGVLDIDQGLMGADYRAPERLAQLIVQVAGRAGRAERIGRVLIQTRHPDHPLLQTLVRGGYGAFAQRALAERQAAHLPPFSHQALLRAQAPRPQAPSAFLEQAAALARTLDGDRIDIWGPVPAPMERRAGRFRAHLLVQCTQRPALQSLLAAWVPRLPELETARAVRWSLDVDPQELF